MVDHMSYSTISMVLDTWERARLLPNFEEVAGVAALKVLFELNPRTKEVFGMDRTYMVTEDDIKNSSYLVHAYSMIRMFDGVFQLLGPDSDTLREILQDLGKRRIGYGVPAQFLPYMGQLIIQVLKGVLGPDVFTPAIEDAWIEVFDEFSGEMMCSILNGKVKIREEKEGSSIPQTVMKKRSSLQSTTSTVSTSEWCEDELMEEATAVKQVKKAVKKVAKSKKKSAMSFK